MMKILSRYVFSAAAVAVILLIINFTALAAWLLQTGSEVTRGYSISQMADELNHSQEGYLFPEEVQKQLNHNRQWAMLINDNGTVIWSHHLPGDLPLQYSLSDVAGFSRWYLLDYPVHVWEHEDGLFVLGNQKYSVWKQSIEVPERVMDNSRFWLPLFLILNAVTAVFLALLLGFRLFRSLKKLSGGIEDMKQKRPATLPVHGVLGDLAVGINQASAELARQEAALSKRDNARTTWIAGVSHDIRTPLSIAMGYASRLEEDQSVPADGKALAGIIRGQCERIKTLVSDLNLASKLEYDMQPLRRELIELAPLLRSVAADVLNSGIEDRYTLTISVEEQTKNSVVSADRELLKRALSNLINNSMLHNPNGCTIELLLKKNSPFYMFSVTDNGVGFKTEILNRLNDPKEPAKIQNHGLGLIIVRQIIKAHEGSIVFQNLSEEGCRVTCYLPDNIDV